MIGEAEAVGEARPAGSGMPPNPFPGPQAYTQGDEAYFFGREDEVEELVSLVLSTSIVLLYAPSGTGKSSILQAGLAPILEKDFNFTILPPVHIGTGARTDVRSGETNQFSAAVWEAVTGTSGGVDAPVSIAAALERTKSSSPGQRLLILDQFEEIFNDPALWRERESFLAEITEALQRDSRLRVIIALRSDYLADLVPYERNLPGHLSVRYQLDHLDEAQATSAIRAAFELSGVFLPENTLISRMNLLLEDRQGRRATRVNAIQLQIVFRRLWTELRTHAETRRGRNSAARIESSVRNSMAQYVDEAIAEAALRARGDEAFIRWWLRSQLITSNGRRAFALVEDEQTAGLSNDVLAELAKVRLVQLEQRHGSRLAELTHDSMVDAVRDSNDQWLRSGRTVRRRNTLILLAVMIVLILVAPLLLADHPSKQFSAAGSSDHGIARIPFASTTPGIMIQAQIFNLTDRSSLRIVELLANDEEREVDRVEVDADESSDITLGTRVEKSARYVIILRSAVAEEFTYSVQIDPMEVVPAKDDLLLKSSGAEVGLAMEPDDPHLITTASKGGFAVRGSNIVILGQGSGWAVVKATDTAAVAALWPTSSRSGRQLRSTVFKVSRVGKSFEIGLNGAARVRMSYFTVFKFTVDDSGLPLGLESNCNGPVWVTALDDRSVFTGRLNSRADYAELTPGELLPLNVSPGPHRLAVISNPEGRVDCTFRFVKFGRVTLAKYGTFEMSVGAREHTLAYPLTLTDNAVFTMQRPTSMSVRVMCSGAQVYGSANSEVIQGDRIMEYIPQRGKCVLWLLRRRSAPPQEELLHMWFTPVAPTTNQAR